MIEILDPTLEASAQSLAYVARPDSLKGKRVALIENTKFNSDRLLQKIGDILIKEYGAASAQMWRKKNSSVPAHEQIIEEVKKACDVVVAGVGD
ncbi:MAG: hypothetical protein HY216_18065 [Candidatus Rokubacteria bacterium]|nr:hypothetical protein [Candidatus Rokubacteria bacterium]